MDFLPEAIEAYAQKNSAQEPEYLRELERETHLKVLMPRMLSGPLQGRTLSLLSQLQAPQLALEVGTYTGYGALCLAEGLAPGGKLITLDANEELEEIVRRYLAKAGMEEQIEFRLGQAEELIGQMAGPFDLVFLDADKENYPRYLEQLWPLMRPKGLLLADNVLWSGKVINPEHQDKETEGLRQFTEAVNKLPDAFPVMLPIRDGLMVVRKTD